MEETTFEVPGQPVPQPRHKVAARGRFAHAYIEANHAIHAYREAVARAAKIAGGEPTDDAFVLDIEAVFQRPPSHRNKSGLRAGAPRFPRKCDWDNLGKGVSDAITDSGAFWLDDKQVVDGRCRKRYAEAGEPARTIVTIRRPG